MNQKETNGQDKDMEQEEKALHRAAARAREIAAKTGTPVVTYQDGKVVEEMVVKEDENIKQ